MRIVLLGTESRFAHAFVEGLLDHGLTPEAAFVVGPTPAAQTGEGLSVTVRGSVESTLIRAGSTVVRSADLDAVALERAREAGPELLLTACCPIILNAAWLAVARVAAVNVHPSLLPAFRGPAPVEWQLESGAAHLGVSLHHLTRSIDAGPVIAQTRFRLLPGHGAGPDRDSKPPAGTVSAHDASAVLAGAGARLLAAVLATIGAGADFPVGAQQCEARASYQSWPERSAGAARGI